MFRTINYGREREQQVLKIEELSSKKYLLFNEKKVLELNNPFCIQTIKNICSYKMSRGSFKIKEKLISKNYLSLVGTEQLENGIKLSFSNKTQEQKLNVFAQEERGRLKLTFKKENNSDFNCITLTFPAEEREHLYGCGECFTKLDLRGEKVRIWVAEHQNVKRIVKKIISQKVFGERPDKVMKFGAYETYYSQPTFVSSDKYFVHVNSNAYMEFDFTQGNCHKLMIRDAEPVIYFAAEPSFEDLFKNLSGLLGHGEPVPDWAFEGVILGMQGGTATILKKLQIAKEYDFKVAGVWCQDWEGERITSFGKQLMWNWKWDPHLYPNLDKEIIKLKKEGIRFLGYINPFLAMEKELFQYAKEHGYCVKDKNGDIYTVKITTFDAAMVDFTNPEAYEWLKGIIKENMIEFGLSGWMADFGEYLPCDCCLFNNSSAEEIHNTWPAVWAKLNKEAVAECGKQDEILFFTRAGHTGTISSSPLMWNGDQHVDWSLDDGLPSVIPATLSLAMSGFGICHSDIGGYTSIGQIRRDRELLMRWCELGAFSPVMRSHEGNRPMVNLQYDCDEEMLRHFAKMSKIHSMLANYLKECSNNYIQNGQPVMRPLFFHYDETSAFEESYEYLIGKDILVAPVIKKAAVNRETYLPKDNWIHLWSGKEYHGGRITINSPVGKPPVFIRKDSKWLSELLEISKL